MTSYKRAATDFVAFVVSAAAKKLPSSIKVDLPPDQEEAAKSYQNSLSSEDEGLQDKSLQALLWEVFSHKARGDQVTGSLPYYLFLVLYSFKKDGGLDMCSNITRTISKMVYLGRTAIFNHIQAEMDAEGKGFYE